MTRTGVIFKDKEAKLASYDVFDQLNVTVAIFRNPDPDDDRPIHIVRGSAFPALLQLLNAAHIEYEVTQFKVTTKDIGAPIWLL